MYLFLMNLLSLCLSPLSFLHNYKFLNTTNIDYLKSYSIFSASTEKEYILGTFYDNQTFCELEYKNSYFLVKKSILRDNLLEYITSTFFLVKNANLSKEIIIAITVSFLVITVIFSCIKLLNINDNLQEKINNLLTIYSNNKPILDTNDIKWSNDLRINYKKIYYEYINFINNVHNPELHSKQIGKFAIEIDKDKKWKSIILYAFGKKTEYSKYFPYTMKLLNNTPTTLAMFSIMEPGAVLTPHKGVYSGVLRYHLGLKTPKEYTKCRINIYNNEEDKILEYNWEEGKDIYFDDMYTHWVHNNTNEQRVILFVDIKKKFNNFFINILNNIILFILKYNYNKDFVLNQDIVKINNLLNKNNNNKIKKEIFPYFIEDVIPTKDEKRNFLLFYKDNKLNSEINNFEFWIKYYTFMRRDNVYSMSSKSDINLIEELINIIIEKDIDGDIVEIGSWRCGVGMYLRQLLKNSNKKIWLFDTFNKFPKSENENINDTIYNFYKNTYLSVDKIIDNFKKLNLYKNIELIDGNILKTLYNSNLNKISLLRLDCDLYEPILLSLKILYPKVEKGGIILIDDYYNYLVNCYKAVNDFRKEYNITSPIIKETNGDSIFWIK